MLNFCSCQTICNSICCKCKKNDLTCTDMCFSKNCEKRVENLNNKELDLYLKDDLCLKALLGYYLYSHLLSSTILR